MDKTTLKLRKILGILGMCLPIAIIISRLITTRSLAGLESISATHYFPDYLFFEGLVLAVGLFLILYNGYDIKDRWLTTIAGSGAIVMVFFPGLAPKGFEGAALYHNFLGISHKITMWFHDIGALVFFGFLIYIILKQFTCKGSNPTREKLIRNKIYIACGWTMTAALLIGGAINVFLWPYALFIGEAIGLECFGVAWFVKGECIFKDKEA